MVWASSWLCFIGNEYTLRPLCLCDLCVHNTLFSSATITYAPLLSRRIFSINVILVPALVALCGCCCFRFSVSWFPCFCVGTPIGIKCIALYASPRGSMRARKSGCEQLIQYVGNVGISGGINAEGILLFITVQGVLFF